MAEPVMKYGARKGNMNFLRRRIAKASAKEVRIFPVPGADILRLYQNESKGGAFRLAPNPREANVLLVMGKLTHQLAQKAAVAYQQIPRPRVLLFAGPDQLPHLPEPDAHVSLNNNFLDDVLPTVQELLRNHAWSEHAEPWEPEFLVEIIEGSENGGGHNHHHDHHHKNGEEDAEHNPEEHDHKHEENDEDHESHDQHGGHNNHDHGSRDHGDMDFMSMVAMTKDLPRPKDGLPMNRSEVHFGPFHPGLTGGLSVFMELDGDTVIEARAEHGLLARSINKHLPVDAQSLPELLAGFNPLTPQTYKLLGQRVIRQAVNDTPGSLSPEELILLEKERVASHLNWLATFGKTVGNARIHSKAARWHNIHKKGFIEADAIHPFLEQIRNMPYLRKKLKAGGIIPEELVHHLSGPVAKAAGKELDARSEDRLYLDLGWEPIINTENNAWGRLLVRLGEIEQSLDLVNAAEKNWREEKDFDFTGSGEGAAKVESPRGILSLRVSIQDGIVEELEIEAPSKLLAGLVNAVAKEEELSDALVQIASLDISPWEIGLKKMEEVK